MGTLFIKDPQAILDYKFDWASNTNGGGADIDDWLAAGETIASFVMTADAGITVESSSSTDTNTSVTVWLSGGQVGKTYEVACRITTTSTPARVDERTIAIEVRNR
jgi:hypothetical protein